MNSLDLPIPYATLGTMSRISFKVFCLESYSRHRQLPANRVYAIFKSSGVLALIDSDYEDLHGLGIEALMEIFDQYLQGVKI